MDRTTKISGVNQALQSFYQGAGVSERLRQAISYSIDAGGKRIRPLLLLDLLEAFGQSLTTSHFQLAAALEMIHTGSLIHDDLPAMDDDDYRRGQLTNHKRFDEATAILAGDSLFLDPFGLIASTDLPAQVKVDLILELSQASGSLGMVAGQMLDMQAEGQTVTLDQLQLIHANKTGQLLTFPFVAAGRVLLLAEPVLDTLRQLGQLTGLAFQVRDDILDLTADFEVLGKTPQKDLLAEKSTYPALLGLDGAKRFLDETLDQAVALLGQLSQMTSFDGGQVQELLESLRLNG